jgi:hypothetical protein
MNGPTTSANEHDACREKATLSPTKTGRERGRRAPRPLVEPQQARFLTSNRRVTYRNSSNQYQRRQISTPCNLSV